MSNLSDKELLEMMAKFPKHELSTKGRTEVLKKISEDVSTKRKRPVNNQKMSALAAVLFLAFIGPILYFSNTTGGNDSRSGSVTTDVQEANYFALEDQDGKPLYATSNFGIPNKVSLLAPEEWIANDKRSVAKIMIFLWGDYKEFANKPLNVDAVNVKTGEKERLTEAVISGGLYGSDAHALTSFKPFSAPGVWNLQFSVGNKKIGEFSIYVKEGYITIGKATLLTSPEDLYAGEYEHEFIEVEGENLPEEIELKISEIENNDAKTTTFLFKKVADYTTTDGKKISHYGGAFTLEKSGQYQFSVLEESREIEVRKPIDQK
ncbi:hypothetical protein [Bacillus sp. FJAT-29814]|uniref:hypothetical protein n=1 Tax=Bacillus sp. FJAT-29814 TaxID=1729688 RepID=UPI00083284FF|nr:hypothetical protein [Bacillus sp. FJAT-29814]